MGSTHRSPTPPNEPPALTAGTLRWRSWPLVECPAWSWMVPVGLLLTGTGVYSVGGGLLLAASAMAALAIALRTFLMPVAYEVTPAGLRRRAAGRVRLVPWPAVLAYQIRSTGVLLFQRPNPTPLDVPGGLFVPFPAEAEEFLAALELYLPHATAVLR